MTDSKLFYIYRITNLINNKIYIGISFNPKGRYHSHFSAAEHKPEKNKTRFSEAIREFGCDKKVFNLEILSEHVDRASALKEEIKQISLQDARNPEVGYNIAQGGDGYPSYDSLSDETKERLRTRPRKPLSLETRQQMDLKISKKKKGRPAHNKGQPCIRRPKTIEKHQEFDGKVLKVYDEVKDDIKCYRDFALILNERGIKTRRNKNWTPKQYFCLVI